MNDYIKSSIIINIEITDKELLSKIDTVCTELSLSLDQFMLYAINKLLYDIKLVHSLRSINNKNM